MQGRTEERQYRHVQRRSPYRREGSFDRRERSPVRRYRSPDEGLEGKGKDDRKRERSYNR